MFALGGDLGSAVLEGNFNSSHASQLLELHPNPIEIFCRCEKEELLRRIRERRRHPGHLDDITEKSVADGVPSDHPLRLGGPFLEVDTTGRVDMDALFDWLDGVSAGVT